MEGKQMEAVKTNDLSREEWLEQRRSGIGGSDIGAIAGLSKWSSPIKVYMQKVDGLYEDLSNNEAVYWGNALENLVAQEFSRRTGYKVRRRNAILQHSVCEWALANVDRLIMGNKERGPGVLEVKTANAFSAKEWENDEIPANYLVQLQWYLFVTGYKWGAFAALIGGQKFVMKEVERDDELIKQLVKIADDFWNNHVAPKIPPELDGSQASSDLLSALYPTSTPGTEIELPSKSVELLNELDILKVQKNEIDEQINQRENQLKEMIGENEKAISGERIITWKTVSSNRIDSTKLKKEQPDIYKQYTKQSHSRRFQIK